MLIVDNKGHNLAIYLHAACFLPCKSTFIKAIQHNFLISWAGLTTQLIKKYLPTIVHTELGHIKVEKTRPRSN